MERHAIDAVDALARHLHNTGEIDQAIGVLDHAISVIDPYNESLYQKLIRIHQQQGRPKAAARVLDALIAEFAKIDANLSPQTIALAKG